MTGDTTSTPRKTYINSAAHPRGGGSTPRVHARASVGARETDDGGGSSLRKAAVLLVSLEQPLASQLLAQLDREAVEAVTLEIARLDRITPDEQQAVLEEFYALGVRRLRFVFEDIARIDDHAVREAYHNEDAATWVLALAGAARAVRTRVLNTLPAEVAESLRQSLARLGPFRLDDAETAQAEIAERLRRLHDQGRVNLPEPSGQEEILV